MLSVCFWCFFECSGCFLGFGSFLGMRMRPRYTVYIVIYFKVSRCSLRYLFDPFPDDPRCKTALTQPQKQTTLQNTPKHDNVSFC